jgi:hypothetical protein
MSYLKKVSTITLATTFAFTIVVSPILVHAEEGRNEVGKRTPALKRIENLASRSGDYLKKTEEKYATRSEKLKERFATRAGELEKKIASRGAQFRGNHKERLTKLSENMEQRFTRITERQENILKRANIRIASISAEGKNVSDLNSKSASVSAMIAKQKVSIAALKTTLSAIVTTNGTGGETVGKAISDVVKQVTATHQALNNLVHAIAKLSPPKGKPVKSGSPKPSVSASASPAVSATPSPTSTATLQPTATPEL